MQIGAFPKKIHAFGSRGIWDTVNKNGVSAIKWVVLLHKY